MKRIKKGGQEYIIGYHTQEFRPEPLSEPIICKGKTAWLGIGYYFWTDLDFAHYWGIDFKRANTGYYEIYQAYIKVDNCINAVFDEEGYFFFRQKIEEAIQYFKDHNINVTLEKVNKFLTDNIWGKLGVEGIIYDDKPLNSARTDRIHSEIPDLYYKKRIQIVVFNKKNYINFDLLLEEQDGSEA